MNVFRSVGAVFLGFLVWVAILYLTSAVVPNVISPTPFGTLDMVVTGARWVLGALGAGLVTAAVASGPAWKPCAVVGVLSIISIWFLVAWGDLDFFLPAFIHSASALILMASLTGSYLIGLLRKRRARGLA